MAMTQSPHSSELLFCVILHHKNNKGDREMLHLQFVSTLVSVAAFLWIFQPLWIKAQIVPDNSLGNENSVVVPHLNINGINSDRIDGGAIRGSNLFHSFQDFNIENGHGAYFSNPENITNILTRVTGNNSSNILGTLGVLGNANLFFINPNGIVFGVNARLDIGGSFFASTADGILFENGVEFAASNPVSPPLLTINMPLGLNFRENPGSIINQSIAVNQQNNRVGLQVPNQSTLGLIGGEIRLENGKITAQQGQIELGSVSENSVVRLQTIPSLGYNVIYDNVSEFGDISLTQKAEVETSGNGGGAISIHGRTVRLTEESKLTADTRGNQDGEGIFIQAHQFIVQDGSQISASAVEESTGKSGGIQVNALEFIEIIGTSNPSLADNNSSGGNQGDNNNNENSENQLKPSKLASDARGFNQAGDLIINTQALTLRDGAKISASTIETDGGGNIIINANDFVQIIGTSIDGRRSSGISVQTRGNGQAGDITINTNQLILQTGAEVSASTFGNGDSGSININASQSVELTGVSTTGELPSRIIAETGEARETVDVGVVMGSGSGGDLKLTTPRLIVQDGARISVSTFGQGDAGDLIVQAEQTQLRGVSVNGLSSGLFAFVESGATGNGGRLILETQRLLIAEGAKISGATFGDGNGGNLIITGTEIDLVGTSVNGQVESEIAVSVEPEAQGNAGNLNIETQRLTIRDGAVITAETLGNGDGGRLTVTSEEIEIIGESANGQFPSALLASVGEQAKGNEGALTIYTQRLIVADGGEIFTGTAGDGDGGDLIIHANDIEISGISAQTQTPSGLSAKAESTATGEAGELTINAETVTLKHGAAIDVRSEGTEAAGDLIINATNIFLNNQASLNGETTAGEGNITLNTSDLRLGNNSNITTNATGKATGGNITMNTETLTALENSDISANAEDAFGGRIIINAAGVFGTAFREQQTQLSDITATSELGPEFSGTVELNTELDPSSGLIDLSQTVVDPNDLIAAEFCRQRGNSAFTITGRGGIAADPNDKSTADQIDVNLVEPVATQSRNSSRTRSEVDNNQPISSLDIIPARGWIRDENGDVILVSYDPTKTAVPQPPYHPYRCQIQ